MREAKEESITTKVSEKVQHSGEKRSHAWIMTFKQFIRYCLVGGINTGFDLLILNILLWRFPTNNVQVLVVYNSIAYTGGAVSSFFLNKYWTFGHRQKATWKQVRRFIITLFFEVLYSNALIWFAGKALQPNNATQSGLFHLDIPFMNNPIVWGNASKLVAIVVGTVISYLLMRFWTFANKG